MARVPTDWEKIRESLRNAEDALQSAIKFAKDKEGEIELEVLDPYSHEIPRGPASGGLLGCSTLEDPCYDIGVMTGVFKIMPKAKAKTRRRE